MTAPAEPAPDVPLGEPTPHDWDEDPRTCARYDRAWFDRDED
ncbi:hypothetical protein OIE52_39245 [Streptomyces canus]